jgi:hypothetical protein
METGTFSEAAVEGLMSCAGEGARFIEPVWMVSPISRGRESDIFAVDGFGLCSATTRWELEVGIFEARKLAEIIDWFVASTQVYGFLKNITTKRQNVLCISKKEATIRSKYRMGDKINTKVK